MEKSISPAAFRDRETLIQNEIGLSAHVVPLYYKARIGQAKLYSLIIRTLGFSRQSLRTSEIYHTLVNQQKSRNHNYWLFKQPFQLPDERTFYNATKELLHQRYIKVDTSRTGSSFGNENSFYMLTEQGCTACELIGEVQMNMGKYLSNRIGPGASDLGKLLEYTQSRGLDLVAAYVLHDINWSILQDDVTVTIDGEGNITLTRFEQMTEQELLAQKQMAAFPSLYKLFWEDQQPNNRMTPELKAQFDQIIDDGGIKIRVQAWRTNLQHSVYRLMLYTRVLIPWMENDLVTIINEFIAKVESLPEVKLNLESKK